MIETILIGDGAKYYEFDWIADDTEHACWKCGEWLEWGSCALRNKRRGNHQCMRCAKRDGLTTDIYTPLSDREYDMLTLG